MNQDIRDVQHLQAIARRETHPAQAQSALDALDAAHRQPIQRFLSAKFKGTLAWEDIEDITQQVYLKVWEQAASFRREGTVRAWLFGIAIRLALELVRKRQRQGELLEQHPIPARDPETPEHQVLLEDQHRQLQTAIEQLSPQAQSLLRLRYQLECSYETMAQQLHVSIGTVKSRLHRAKQRLARILSDLGMPRA